MFSQHLEYSQFLIVLLVAFLVGMSKTGLQGAGMLTAPLMAIVYGGKLSSGVILPMLVFADIFGVWYYHKHAEWKFLKHLFPWAALGIIAGTIVGNYIDDGLFKSIMAGVILISIAIMIWQEKANKKKVDPSPLFTGFMGLAGGFTSMIGNLAGTVMAVYFLSVKLPKNPFIGTTAWFFLIINLAKVPFHIFFWHTINTNTFLFNLTTIPAILAGAFLGIFIVKKLSDKVYRWFIIVMTLAASGFMLI